MSSETDDIDAVTNGLAAWLACGATPPAQTSLFVSGKLIDLVAVRHALEGTEAEKLSPAEKRFAAEVGTRAGLSARDIGKRIGTTQRTVVRYRGLAAQTAGAAA